MPGPVETAAYFMVAESLTNAVKHAEANALVVRIARRDGNLLVEIVDDGVGGADLDGSGLRGLADRVNVLGGRFTITSPCGEGTRLLAELPCGS